MDKFVEWSPGEKSIAAPVRSSSICSPVIDPTLKYRKKARHNYFDPAALVSPIQRVGSPATSHRDRNSAVGKESVDGDSTTEPDEAEPSEKRRKVIVEESDEFLELSCEEEANSDGNEEQAGFIGPARPPKTSDRKRVDTSLSSDSNKLSHESIAKFIAHECDCGKDCSATITRKQVHDLRHGNVSLQESGMTTGDVALRVLKPIAKKNPFTGGTIFDYTLHGSTMCEFMFRSAHGITQNAWRRAKTAVHKGLDDVPKASRSTGSFSARVPREQFADRSERAEQTMSWCTDYIKLHGCQMPDSRLVYIDDISVRDLCGECAREVAPLIEPLKPRQFRRVWDKNFAMWCKKRARKPFGTCTDCAGYKARLAQNARDRETIGRIKSEYLAHLNEQKIERHLYYDHRKKGIRWEACSLIVDGMDQSKLVLPHYKLIPKDVANFLETKITGVLVHGKRFDCYVSEPQVKHNSNLNLTCIHNTLMELAKEGPLPRVLYLQVDGGAENKNQWMVSYLSMLIEVGMFDKIKMCFLPVGHTHEDIDQAFSRIAVYLNRHDALTYDEFLGAIRASFLKEGRPPNIISIGHAFDFKAWLNGRLPNLSSWTDNLCYRFAKNVLTGKPEMHYKFFGASEAYLGGTTECRVTSFKALQSKVSSDPSEVAKHAGIEMPTGIPDGVPPMAENLNFGAVEQSKDAGDSSDDDNVPLSR